MSHSINPPLVAKDGKTLRVLLICRVSDPGPEKQDERSLDDQEVMHREWLKSNTELPIHFEVIAGDGSGERLDRDETAQAESKIATGDFDLVLCEDLGRIFRRMHAYLFCEAAEDANTRVIAINDHVDTANDGWRMSAFFAAMRHEMYNADTGKRIRRTLRNRFSQGGAFQCEIYGYVKPRGAKSDQDVSKDPVAEPIYDRWFSLLEEGASYSEVADWLNELGAPTGPYSRSATWTGRMVKRVTFNPIIKGVRERNRRKSRRINKTGRRRSVIAPPEDLLQRDVPHLAFIEAERYDRVISLLTDRNEMYRRGRECNKDPLEGRSKKDTRWPGQSVICGVCGRPYVFGAHGQTNRLMCDGAREYHCWNGISLDAGLACDRMLAMVFNGLMELQGFDDALVAELQEEYAQLDIERIRTFRELEQKLSQIQKQQSNILATIRDDGGNRTLVNELTRLENGESELERKLTTIRSVKRPALDLPSIEQLRIAARTSVSDLPHDSVEFARHMRRLISPIYVYPYRLHDGGHIVLRTEMTLSLVSLLKPHLQECTVAGTPLSQTLVVDTFESPQREAFRDEIVQLTSTTDLTERQIADRLGITQPVVQRAKKLQRLLNRLGQTDPYAPVTEPPDDYAKLRRHLHKRYRFEPLDGFPRPWPV